MTVDPSLVMAADEAPAPAAIAAQRSPWRRFLQDPFVVFALLWLAFIVFLAIFGHRLAPFDPGQIKPSNKFAHPSGDHWLGTDHLGRDVWSRLMVGSRVAVRVSVQVLLTVLVLGVPIGLLAGYRGGWLDNVLMRIMDAIASVPPLVFALAIVAATETGLKWALPAISVAFVPGVARVVRGEALAVREETFIEASRSIGTPSRRILWKRVLPNVSSVIIVQATFIMAAAILVEAALSIIGAGVKPGEAAWGSMIAEAFVHKEQSFLNMFWPGLAISLTSLSYNLVGDGLRDVLGIDTGRGAGVRGRLGLTTVVGAQGRAARSARASASTARASRTADLEAAIARDLGDELPRPDIARGVPAALGAPPLLAVEGLTVEFALGGSVTRVVEDVSFTVGPGEVVGLVGESGSGKTVTSLAIMRLIPSPPGRIVSGSVDFAGRDLLGLSFREMRAVRGREIAMIFQDPMSSLNPAFTVGDQIGESLRLHEGLSGRAAERRALEMLDRVGIPAARRRIDQYPHQFSGGMRQRVMIAMALACRPRLLIADEPTTALDVTVQAQILELLREIRREMGLSVIFVTHDLGVVADLCDRVLVMYAGQIVESAEVEHLFARPTHPYTEGLLRAMPRVDGGAPLAIGGRVPPAGQYPDGCRFHPRCAYVRDECRTGAVALRPHAGALTRCVRAEELVLGGAGAAATPEHGR